MPWKLYETTVSRSFCDTLSSLALATRFFSTAAIAAGSDGLPFAEPSEEDAEQV